MKEARSHLEGSGGGRKREGGLDGDRLLCQPLQWQNNQEWQEYISNLGYAWTTFSYPSHKTLSVRARRVESSKIWITKLWECI